VEAVGPRAFGAGGVAVLRSAVVPPRSGSRTATTGVTGAAVTGMLTGRSVVDAGGRKENAETAEIERPTRMDGALSPPAMLPVPLLVVDRMPAVAAVMTMLGKARQEGRVRGAAYRLIPVPRMPRT